MSVVNPQSQQHFKSAYDDVQARLAGYTQSDSIEENSDARLLSDYGLSIAWAECNFDAGAAAKRIRTEFYDRHRIDLDVVTAHLGHAPRFMTEVDEVSEQLDRDRRRHPHRPRRRLSTYGRFS